MNDIEVSRQRVVILDVEGVTTPVHFVRDTLLPYAREHLPAFLHERRDAPDTVQDIDLLRREWNRDRDAGEDPPVWESGSALAYVLWLLDRRRESNGLRALQGKIWQEGFLSGRLKGEVYPDVRPFLERWQKTARAAGVYSAGSVLAQQLLFTHSVAGDLTPFILAHFDTRMGSKREAASYARIAAQLDCPPAEMMVISDVIAELHAARAAGVQTIFCFRPQHETPGMHDHPVIESLDDLRF